MSANFNSITLAGNLTKDPKPLEFTSGGTQKGVFRIAVNRKYKKGTEMVEDPLFIDVEVWENLAANCHEYLKKGLPVLVSGQLRRDEWTGKDNEPHEKWYVVAHVVQFLGKKGESADDSEDSNIPF
jgi:single-strand DNA-binding protein